MGISFISFFVFSFNRCFLSGFSFVFHYRCFFIRLEVSLFLYRHFLLCVSFAPLLYWRFNNVVSLCCCFSVSLSLSSSPCFFLQLIVFFQLLLFLLLSNLSICSFEFIDLPLSLFINPYIHPFLWSSIFSIYHLSPLPSPGERGPPSFTCSWTSNYYQVLVSPAVGMVGDWVGIGAGEVD